jgi:YD repeat-containing protein
MAFAQSSNNAIAFPSSNNSFLGKGGSTTQTGVDLFTGTAQVSVPICALNSLDMSIPISLSYVDGRGVKIQEYASQVGLGWQINAGGGISRVVRGFPDEQQNGYLGDGSLPSGAIGTGQQWGKVVANELSNTVVWTSAQATAITGINGTSSGPPTADGEPDIYYVKTPFFSAQFTFDENGNAIFPNSNGLKVIANNFYNSGSYGNSSFEVIDEQGNQYYFGSSSSSVENTTTTLFNTSYTFPTTWYLDKIVSFNSRDVITLSYASYASSDVNNHYMSTTYFDGFGHVNTDNTPVTSTVLQPKMVTTISGPLGEIDLSYATGRQDDNNAVQLSSIVLKAYNPLASYNGTTLKTFNFNYSYFGSPSSDPNVLRLRLDNITVAGNTTQTSTPVTLKTFTYNTSLNLPSRTSLSSVDYFGYYTYYSGSNTYNQSLPANVTYAQADILTAVKDITGSSWNFYYELNDYLNSGTNTPVGGLRVNKLAQTLPSGESIYTTYSYVDASGKSTGQILSNSYLINIGYSSCGVNKTFSESPSDYYDLNGNFVGYSSVKATDQTGGYSISTFSNFSNFPDNLNYANSNPNGIPDITSSISLAYKRGLMLDQAVYDASGNLLRDDATPLASYVSLTSPAAKKAWAYHWANMTFGVSGSGYSNSCSFGASSTYWAYVENFRPQSVTHTDYDQVTRSASVQKNISYTYSSVNKRLVKTVTSTDSKGLSLTQTYYYPDESTIPMVSGSSEQNSITALSNANRVAVPIHESDNRNGTITQVHNTYSTSVNNNLFLTQTSAYVSDPVNTTATLVKQENFTYDVVTSNLVASSLLGGKPTGYLYKYKSALPVAKAVNAVSTYNTTMVPASQYATINLTTANSGTTTFTSQVTGNIVLQINANAGTTYSIFYSLSGPSNQSGYLCAQRSAVTCSYPETATLNNMPAGTYTLYINLNSGSSSSKGITATYTVLTPSTAVTAGFFFEGFEDGAAGTWGSNAHSGNAYYNGINSPYSVTFTRPDSRSYIIQWWSWTAGGKWVMHQQAYTGTMTLPGIIDDVRIFPSDAMLTTMTYNPLVGVTGETDPSGRTTTTEYDGLSRVSVQRDLNRNIIAKNCYNFAGQSISCPVTTTWSNSAQSQAFTRNNCGSGYIAGGATYTVAAGTYTSTISQSDADQQAYNDIALNGQNYANTNGTCTPMWHNVAQSGNFTRNNCPAGYNGTTVTYTVAAGTYGSAISQADADQQAINDVNANGQNYANANGICSLLYYNVPESGNFTRNNCPSGYAGATVTYTVAANTYSSTVSQADANQKAINDVNANGQNYANANAACLLLYYNVVESGNFTRNNCPSGYTGTTVTYTVAANTYSSTISQADANQKAINDVNANGQSYANAHGACNQTPVQHFGDLIMSGNSTAQTSFTTAVVGTITLSIDPNAGTTYSLSYNLSGPSPKSGTLCVSRSAVTCGSTPSTATFTNMPIGTYTLTINLSSGTSSSKGMSYTYYAF